VLKSVVKSWLFGNLRLFRVRSALSPKICHGFGMATRLHGTPLHRSPDLFKLRCLISHRTSYNVSEQRIIVDLDAEKGRLPREGRIPDQVKVVIRPAKVVRMAVIDAYLNRTMPWDNSILEAISKFLCTTSILILIIFRLSGSCDAYVAIRPIYGS